MGWLGAVWSGIELSLSGVERLFGQNPPPRMFHGIVPIDFAKQGAGPVGAAAARTGGCWFIAAAGAADDDSTRQKQTELAFVKYSVLTH